MSEFKGRGKGPARGGFKSGGGAGGGARKPYAKREGGFKPRGEGEGGYRPREGGAEGGYKPRGERSFGERKPYVKREGGFKPRGEGEGGYRPREGGSEGGYKPRGERSFGERKPYVKREGGFKPRGEGEGGYRPRGERSFEERGSGERRPYEARGASGFRRSQRVERFDADRPAETSWEQGREREEGRGKRRVEYMHPQADGWLVGPHAVKAALKAGRRAVKELWVTESPAGELAELVARYPQLEVQIHERADFDGPFGELVHQGIALQVGNLPQPEFSEVMDSKPKLIVALDQVTDPHNVGAILRSCAAYGVGAVLTPERRSAGVTPVVAKAAAGGLEVVPVVEIVNLAQSLKQLKDAGYTVLGLAGEGTLPLTSVQVDGPLCLVLGSEGDGLRRLTKEGCDHLVRIPQDEQAVGSLNVSVATGIALYALTR